MNNNIFKDIGTDISLVIFETINNYEKGEKYELVNLLLKSLKDLSNEFYKNVISLELIVIFIISSLVGIKRCNLNNKDHSIVVSSMRTIVIKIISDMYNDDMRKIEKWLGDRIKTYSQIIFNENGENTDNDVFLHFLAYIQDDLNIPYIDIFLIEDIENEFQEILITFPNTISKLIKQRINKIYTI